MDYYINNTLGVSGIASKWTIRLIILSGVRGTAGKWTIQLIMRSGVIITDTSVGSNRFHWNHL
jgi:hypothetical protein